MEIAQLRFRFGQESKKWGWFFAEDLRKARKCWWRKEVYGADYFLVITAFRLLVADSPLLIMLPVCW